MLNYVSRENKKMRGKPAKKRLIEPDSRYGSTIVAKMINYVMERGKKGVAEKIVYNSLDEASAKLNSPILTVLDQAIKNTSPLMEVRSYRVGGANYQVPMEVSKSRRLSLSLRWILKAAKAKKGAKMALKLAGELIDAYNGQGAAVKKRDDTHKMAEANKAFAHFARH